MMEGRGGKSHYLHANISDQQRVMEQKKYLQIQYILFKNKHFENGNARVQMRGESSGSKYLDERMHWRERLDQTVVDIVAASSVGTRGAVKRSARRGKGGGSGGIPEAFFLFCVVTP